MNHANHSVMTCSLCSYIQKYIHFLFTTKNNTNTTQGHHEHHEHHEHNKEITSIRNKYINKHVCGICLDSNGELCINRKKKYKIITLCGHIFHKQCLKKWLQTVHKKKCPTCRAKITHPKIFL